jgi:hypothetical protein
MTLPLRHFAFRRDYIRMNRADLRRAGFSLAFSGLFVLSAAQALADSPRPTTSLDVHSVAQLTAEIQKLEAAWDDPKWNRDLAHQQIRVLITRFVTYQLNHGSAARNSIERNLTAVIQDSMGRSWSEHPARVLLCCSGEPRLYIVAFVLDEAAGGSTSVIQFYTPERGSWILATEGGNEMDGCDMDVLLLPFSSSEIRFFAYGRMFGGNQGSSMGVLYSFSGGHIRPIWKLKPTEGLTAKLKGHALVLEYRDTIRFHDATPPYQFQDVYVQSREGLNLITHRPLD